MNFISKLFKKKEEETEVVSKGSVEEFVTLIRVYYQAVMAVQLGITNLNILNDMALFKRMLKIPTQNNKLGIAEKSRSRKILMQEYGLNENFFKEIDASIKKNCKTQNDIKSYFIMYQGFNNDLFSLLDNLMQWKFRFSMLVKKLLYSQTQKTIHEIVTRSERCQCSESRLENTEIQRNARLFGRMDDRLRVQCRADGQRRCQKTEERRQITP